VNEPSPVEQVLRTLTYQVESMHADYTRHREQRRENLPMAWFFLMGTVVGCMVGFLGGLVAGSARSVVAPRTAATVEQ
jgi:purine-cytosine permease-like protein